MSRKRYVNMCIRRDIKSIRRELFKGSSEPFLYFITLLENPKTKEIAINRLNVMKKLNPKVYEQLYNGLSLWIDGK